MFKPINNNVPLVKFNSIYLCCTVIAVYLTNTFYLPYHVQKCSIFSYAKVCFLMR